MSIKQKFLERNKVYNGIHLIQQIVLNYDRFVSIGLIDYRNNRKTYVYKSFKNVNRNNIKKLCENVIENQFIENDFFSGYSESEFNALAPTPDNDDFYPESTSPLINDQLFLENQNDSSNFIDDSSNLNINDLNNAIEVIKKMSKKPENSNILNVWSKRILKAKNDSQVINVIATGGVTNKNILSVQSRIRKNSNKNRFPDLNIKPKVSKPHSISNAIKKNVRNKFTQSKK